jgi:hypothetical protein
MSPLFKFKARNHDGGLKLALLKVSVRFGKPLSLNSAYWLLKSFQLPVTVERRAGP